MSTQAVNRREALRRLAIGGAGVAAMPVWVETLSALALDHAHPQKRAAATAAAWKPKVFTPQQNETVITLTELIIPQTDTPGAKAAKVNEFIDTVLADAKADHREKFIAGLTWIDERATKANGAPFVKNTPEQQIALLTRLSNTADAKNAAAQEAARATMKTEKREKSSETQATAAVSEPEEPAGVDFFTAIKSMTITGYYTSEPGMRQELGDDGTMFFPEFKGCTHPEHQLAQ
jgi:hypothetical protein